MTDPPEGLRLLIARHRWENEVVRDALRGNLRVPPDTAFLPAPDVLRRAKGYLKQGGCGPERGPGWTGDEGVGGGPARPFAAVLRDAARLVVIGRIRQRGADGVAPWTDPERLAQTFAEGEAVALACHTGAESSGGRPEFVPRMRAVFAGPVLRHDLHLDVLDVAVAAALGADALSLLVAALGPDVARLLRETRAFGLEALVEVHDRKELDLAMIAGAEVLGTTHRDGGVDQEATARLATQVPAWAVLVGQSEVRDEEHAARLRRAGCDAIVVGERLGEASKPSPDTVLKREPRPRRGAPVAPEPVLEREREDGSRAPGTGMAAWIATLRVASERRGR